jgi:hypothetical protein
MDPLPPTQAITGAWYEFIHHATACGVCSTGTAHCEDDLCLRDTWRNLKDGAAR